MKNRIGPSSKLLSLWRTPKICSTCVAYSFHVFLKNGPFSASFSLFWSFQYTVDSKQMLTIYINFCQWVDLNSGPLVGSDRSTNWATTTYRFYSCLIIGSIHFGGRFQHRMPVAQIQLWAIIIGTIFSHLNLSKGEN